MRKHGFIFAVTAAVLTISMCGCKNTSGDTPAANLGETEEQTSSNAPFLTVVSTQSSVVINPEAVWGIGKTFDEITEKYGDVKDGNFNQYSFENGYGIYIWDDGGGIDPTQSDRDKNIKMVKERGGCKIIGEISARDFLIGDLSTLNVDNLASKCGFEVVPFNPTPDGYELYDGYRFAYYTHPSYENMIFSMCYKESGFDEKATFRICYSDSTISDDDVETVRKSYGEDRPVIDMKLIDLDFDGEEELLVLTTQANPRVFEVWEKNSGKMELACSFGAGKLNWIDKISLKQGEIDGEMVHLFSFSMSGENNMTADEVLSVVKKTADGYEVEHLLSRGKITYPDIEEPFSKEFYRKGWNKSDIGMDKDYGDISKEEYEKLYKEYTGEA